MTIFHRFEIISQVKRISLSYLFAGVLVTMIAVAVGAAMSPKVAAQDRPGSFADLAEKLMPTVVNISTAQTVEMSPQDIPQFPPGSPFEEFFKEFFEGQMGPRKMRSLGSGFIIDPKGLIVTNTHVINDADEIEVTLSTGEKLPAEVVGKDSKTDIALLRVKTSKVLPAARLGTSSNLRVGDWVLAIGNPFGLGGSVTSGIVSALGRDINAGPYDDFIQTDAAINRGNSGGPLFNMQGEVVGINSAIISPSGGSIGIGFAVPANTATPIIAQLKEYGETRRGWLGVRIQTVTDEIAEAMGLEKAQGALVAGVTEKGPAEAAGMQAGDIIVEFDGKAVKEMRELPRIVADTPISKQVKVVALRKGQRQTFNVKLGRLEDAESEMAAAQAPAEKKAAASVNSLGLTLSDLTPAMRQRYGIARETVGVIVTKVDATSSAAEKGIMAGDIIVEVGQQAVRTPQEFEARVALAKKEGRKSVILRISRNGTLSFVALGMQ
jgi:serine protease Do